jgi:hypothetical protein
MGPGRKEEAMTDAKARRIARGLQANTEAIHTDAVTWEAFQDRNRTLWREAEAAGVCPEVQGLLRNHEEKAMTKKKTAATAAKTNEGNGKPAEAKPNKEPKAKEPKPEMVVFAIRLLPEERALIHKAAGPAKASKVNRTLAVAASKGDLKGVTEIVTAARPS